MPLSNIIAQAYAGVGSQAGQSCMKGLSGLSSGQKEIGCELRHVKPITRMSRATEDAWFDKCEKMDGDCDEALKTRMPGTPGRDGCVKDVYIKVALAICTTLCHSTSAHIRGKAAASPSASPRRQQCAPASDATLTPQDGVYVESAKWLGRAEAVPIWSVTLQSFTPLLSSSRTSSCPKS